MKREVKEEIEKGVTPLPQLIVIINSTIVASWYQLCRKRIFYRKENQIETKTPDFSPGNLNPREEAPNI